MATRRRLQDVREPFDCTCHEVVRRPGKAQRICRLHLNRTGRGQREDLHVDPRMVHIGYPTFTQVCKLARKFIVACNLWMCTMKFRQRLKQLPVHLHEGGGGKMFFQCNYFRDLTISLRCHFCHHSVSIKLLLIIFLSFPIYDLHIQS